MPDQDRGPRDYFSIRTGRRQDLARIDLSMLRRLFSDNYSKLAQHHYFQEAFGYDCVDAGTVAGTLGNDIEAFFFRKLRKPELWPISAKAYDYSEDDIFDVIELLHDTISKPMGGTYHSWNNCGWHYATFDKKAGQDELRSDFNEILKDYSDGFELSVIGEIRSIAPNGLDTLLEASLENYDPENVDLRVAAAVEKFRHHRASVEEKREAIRALVDVVEFLRPRMGPVLNSKDENDLFNVANNFGIRHHNERQKTDFDLAIWADWMFYHYLATIHTIVRRLRGTGG